MAIKSVTSSAPETKKEPKMTFPFLWKGELTGNIYIRFTKQQENPYCDVKIHPEIYCPFNCGILDEEAWKARLPSTETVILSNTEEYE